MADKKHVKDKKKKRNPSDVIAYPFKYFWKEFKKH
jgi:hypothetical protein